MKNFFTHLFKDFQKNRQARNRYKREKEKKIKEKIYNNK